MRIAKHLPLQRLLITAALATVLAGCSDNDTRSSVQVDAGPVALRRLTAEQYERSIHDILGTHITVPGRLDPDDRRDGLLAVGSTFAGVTPSAFEKYEAAASTIAEQALAEDYRDDLVGCQPPSTSAPDDVCATEFVVRVGRLLFRRSLTDEERDSRIAIARASSSELRDFYEGLELALVSFLVSPEFLFRVEEAEPDPASPSRLRLTGASMASRLSYLLWNTTPDEELLAAGESGILVDEIGLTEQVERLLASDKLETGLRAIFADLYDFKRVDDGLVRKDSLLFPAYTQPMIEEAKEQTLRTIVAHLTEERDYRTLFTTPESFMTRRLGVIYQVPVATANGWEPYVFGQSAERAGLLSHVSLNALHSHAGRSSATLRGKFVREVLLCQTVPDPPADIDFSIVEDTAGELLTARDRLEVHVTNEACAGCHNLMDPIGLALEKFDAIGMYRENENGRPIDTSGELDGIPYDDATGLGEALSQHPGLGPCLVRSLYRYSVGREADIGEEALLDELNQRFADSGYVVSDLLRDILASDGFRTTSGTREIAEPEAGGES